MKSLYRISRSYTKPIFAIFVLSSPFYHIADGGIQHGSVVLLEDLVTNEHCSITVYHQALDDILEKYEDGYIILNKEIIPSIIKTKEEEAKEEEQEQSESSDEDLSVVGEDEDDCEIVEIPTHKREVDEEGQSNVKRQKIE